MNLFQPSDAKQTSTGGPSQANIALLLKILDAAGANPQPSFKQFVGGAKMPQLPQGLGTMLAQLGPDAFKRSSQTTVRPSTPGAVSDITSLLVLLSLLGGKGGATGAISSGIDYGKSGLSSLLGLIGGGGDTGVAADSSWNTGDLTGTGWGTTDGWDWGTGDTGY